MTKDNKDMKKGDEFIVTYEAAHSPEITTVTTTISSMDEKIIKLRNGLSLPIGWVRNGIIKQDPLGIDLKMSEHSMSDGGSVKNSYTNFDDNGQSLGVVPAY